MTSSLRNRSVGLLAALAMLVALAGPAAAQVEPIPSSPSTTAATGEAGPEILAPDDPWAKRIKSLIGRRAMSVAIGLDGVWMYRQDASVRRTPASNEKLLLSLAILDRLGPDHPLPTRAMTEDDDLSDGIVNGPLWILGSGNPEVTTKTMAALAGRIENAGINKISGRVIGSKRGFGRDWDAPGWKSYFPRDYVPLPTALTFNFNVSGGVHIRNPEKRAAAALTKALRNKGVKVTGTPGLGISPAVGLDEVGEVGGPTLETVLRHMNVPSSNFRAEVLGKLLGYHRAGAPGTIAKGAAAIEAFANARGGNLDANDGSGLSYSNKVPPQGMVELLWYAEDEPWGGDLRATLPKGGEGTLASRVRSVTVRAKTGTLDGISALSGWVWLKQENRWAAFSIISRGMPKTTASGIEDAIVTTLHERASL